MGARACPRPLVLFLDEIDGLAGPSLFSVLGHEAAPQLAMMAFLHRVVNGGGYIDREYGLGWKRVDLAVRWPYRDENGKRAEQREAVELKVRRSGDADPTGQGLKQLDGRVLGPARARPRHPGGVRPAARPRRTSGPASPPTVPRPGAWLRCCEPDRRDPGWTGGRGAGRMPA